METNGFECGDTLLSAISCCCFLKAGDSVVHAGCRFLCVGTRSTSPRPCESWKITFSEVCMLPERPFSLGWEMGMPGLRASCHEQQAVPGYQGSMDCQGGSDPSPKEAAEISLPAGTCWYTDCRELNQFQVISPFCSKKPLARPFPITGGGVI